MRPQLNHSFRRNFAMSEIGREFGLANKNGHLNCFLNVCLQALWQFPQVREGLSKLVEIKEGPAELKDLVDSIKKFYSDAID
jgi:hypothetical protein